MQRESRAFVQRGRGNIGGLRADGDVLAPLAEPGERVFDHPRRDAAATEGRERANQLDLTFALLAVDETRGVASGPPVDRTDEKRLGAAAMTVDQPPSPELAHTGSTIGRGGFA